MDTPAIDTAALIALDDVLRGVARSHIMPMFRNLPAGAVRQKSSATDLVTIADEAAEAAIVALLQQHYPGALMVGEEACAQEPARIAALRAAPFAFVIDPIDGTANFAAGLPLFGVMLAVVQNGQSIAAIIHDPVSDSSSLACLGQGAQERGRDGTLSPLHVAAAPAALAQARGMASWRFMPPPQRARMLAQMPLFAASWDHRCAAHEYRQLIAGHSDFVVFNRLMPWDHLPGVLLLQEAGGAHLRFDGSAYTPGDVAGGLIGAASLECCEAIRSCINPA